MANVPIFVSILTATEANGAHVQMSYQMAHRTAVFSAVQQNQEFHSEELIISASREQN